MKHIIAVNAGPRKGWNTDLLIKSASEGAQAAGAEVEQIDLYSLETFTGCRSCFSCKREPNFGKCIIADGLKDVLEKIRNADGLIIGSPNYLSDLTAEFRAFFERLIFQSLTYNREEPCCNTHFIPVVLIMTSNAPEGSYTELMNRYKGMFERFVGPCSTLTAGNTLQVKDYSIYNWTIFDPEAKFRSREEDFPGKLAAAYELGKSMVSE